MPRTKQNQHDATHHGEGNAHGIKCQMLMYQNQAQQHCMMMESFTRNFLFLFHSWLTVTKHRTLQSTDAVQNRVRTALPTERSSSPLRAPTGY